MSWSQLVVPNPREHIGCDRQSDDGDTWIDSSKVPLAANRSSHTAKVTRARRDVITSVLLGDGEFLDKYPYMRTWICPAEAAVDHVIIVDSVVPEPHHSDSAVYCKRGDKIKGGARGI